MPLVSAKSWIRDGATALILAALTACYSSPGSLADRGEEALREYRLEEAAVAFQGALDRDPTLPRALYGLGWIYFSQGDKVRARLYFERCMRADPGYYGCHRGMGSLHLNMGFFLQAEESLKRAQTLKPGDPTVLSSLGHLYLVTERLDEAEAMFEAVLEADPTRGEAYYGLAELRFAQGRLTDTLSLLDQAVEHPRGEVKFTELIHELRARTFARLAHDAVKGRGDPPLEPYRSEGRRLYDLALASVDAALETAVLEQKHRLFRMRKHILESQGRLGTAGAP